jgi:hypothetical protein
MFLERLCRDLGARNAPRCRPHRGAAAVAIAALAAACVAGTATSVAAATNPSPPFDECPVVGQAHGCAVLLVF